MLSRFSKYSPERAPRRVNVFACELWIVIEKLFRCQLLGKAVENNGNVDVGASNTRSAAADLNGAQRDFYL